MEQINERGQIITLIHFTYNVNGEWRIACMPNMTEFHQTSYHPNYQRSNELRAVTCPACKKSPQYVQAEQHLNNILKVKFRG